jgi:hypothetical protein
MPEAKDNATPTTDGPAPEAAPPEPPKPEPWTPAKVVEWNAYYDIYVAVGVLLLAFLGSANRITQPSVWSGLHTGRTISATMTPVATDSLSYTRRGTAG